MRLRNISSHSAICCDGVIFRVGQKQVEVHHLGSARLEAQTFRLLLDSDALRILEKVVLHEQYVTAVQPSGTLTLSPR